MYDKRKEASKFKQLSNEHEYQVSKCSIWAIQYYGILLWTLTWCCKLSAVAIVDCDNNILLRLSIVINYVFTIPGGFVDFRTILNQYCQKSRINVPKYSEAPGVLGGYGSQVFVKGQIFTNMKYCGTKKEARHDAAKVALLGLNIPVG